MITLDNKISNLCKLKLKDVDSKSDDKQQSDDKK